jgi:glycosyltransferase involved in cell wall biosynthesis
MRVAPLSVLHVSEPVDGGVARCALDLAGDQVARGWRVAVLAPPDRALATAAERAGATHLPWQLPPRRAAERALRVPGLPLARAVRAVARAAAASQADVVHLHSSQAGLAGRLALRGHRPTVFQPHAWAFYAVDGVLRSAVVAWERLAARWASVTVCVSEGERADGVRAGIRARWRVIPNGVDLDGFRPADDDERAAARDRLELGDGPLVVAVGRISRQKGHDVLLEAWRAVLAAVPAARLVVVGDGPDRAVLEARAPERVRFVGDRDDVPDWLAAADVVAQPSRWEAGASLVVLEAMARGRSVVTTDVAGAEAVGDAGAVVPVEDAASLADAIRDRLRDPERAAREGRAGRERVERSYDVRSTRDAVASLYHELAQLA